MGGVVALGRSSNGKQDHGLQMADMNPYASPPLSKEESVQTNAWESARVGWPILFVGILAGASLGGVLTAFNAWLCPRFYLGLSPVVKLPSLWLSSVVHGIAEGGAFGFGNAALLYAAAVFLARRPVDLNSLLSVVRAACRNVVVLWLASGVIAAVLVACSTDVLYWHAFGWQGNWIETLLNAWCRGSVEVSRWGSPLCTFVAFLPLRDFIFAPLGTNEKLSGELPPQKVT